MSHLFVSIGWTRHLHVNHSLPHNLVALLSLRLYEVHVAEGCGAVEAGRARRAVVTVPAAVLDVLAPWPVHTEHVRAIDRACSGRVCGKLVQDRERYANLPPPQLCSSNNSSLLRSEQSMVWMLRESFNVVSVIHSSLFHALSLFFPPSPALMRTPLPLLLSHFLRSPVPPSLLSLYSHPPNRILSKG